MGRDIKYKVVMKFVVLAQETGSRMALHSAARPYGCERSESSILHSVVTGTMQVERWDDRVARSFCAEYSHLHLRYIKLLL